jgi:nitroalkane oxidase
MPAGLRLTATHDRGRGEYILNGAKYWPSNCGGWDLLGANLNVVAVRTDPNAGGRSGLSYALIPRGTPGVSYKSPIRKLGLNTAQSNWMEFSNCRVSEDQVFAPGEGATVLNRAFTWSGPAVGIAAVGIARSAYEWALEFAKSYRAGGNVPIIEHQAVGYALGDVAMKIEAARYFCWKVAHYLDTHEGLGDPYGAMAKILPTEMLMESVYKCMQVVGVTSLDREHPMERFMRDSMVLPIYDGGNIGMQRRKVWSAMVDSEFNPRGLAENDWFVFKDTMHGIGLTND